MRICWKGLAAIAAVLLTAPAVGKAANCTTQAALAGPDRDALASIGTRLSFAVVQQDFGALQSALLPSMAQEWEGIRGAVEQGAQLMKGGQAQIRTLYLLDA